MRKPSLFVLIGFLAVLCMPVSHALAADVFSFNFESDRATDSDMENILVDEGQIAGIGDWATTGWDNFEIPWNPGPEYEGVAPMTSRSGATATFTLHEARNAGGFQTRAGTRTAPAGDGNGDLMDVAAWNILTNRPTNNAGNKMTASNMVITCKVCCIMVRTVSGVMTKYKNLKLMYPLIKPNHRSIQITLA